MTTHCKVLLTLSMPSRRCMNQHCQKGAPSITVRTSWQGFLNIPSNSHISVYSKRNDRKQICLISNVKAEQLLFRGRQWSWKDFTDSPSGFMWSNKANICCWFNAHHMVSCYLSDKTWQVVLWHAVPHYLKELVGFSLQRFHVPQMGYSWLESLFHKSIL